MIELEQQEKLDDLANSPIDALEPLERAGADFVIIAQDHPQLSLKSAALDVLGAAAIYLQPEKRWLKSPICILIRSVYGS